MCLRWHHQARAFSLWNSMNQSFSLLKGVIVNKQIWLLQIMEELQRKASKVKINYTGMEIKTKKRITIQQIWKYINWHICSRLEIKIWHVRCEGKLYLWVELQDVKWLCQVRNILTSVHHPSSWFLLHASVSQSLHLRIMAEIISCIFYRLDELLLLNSIRLCTWKGVPMN